MARWSRFAPAADRRLVKTLHEGDDDALATLYDVYAERLYDYCVALLDDSKMAADVVHDTFIDAARRAPRLRERERLRAWLYAAARRRCLLRKRPGSMAEDEAFARLDFFQREVLFLAHRHDLTGDDLAATLGVTSRRAQARLERAERQLPDARDFLASAPAPELPAALRHRVIHAGTDPELSGYRSEIAARGGALTTEGMPRQPDAPSLLARRWAIASGGSVATLATATVALMLIGPGVPVPEIQWPGQSPHRPKASASPRHRPSDGPGSQRPPVRTPPPGTIPQLVPPKSPGGAGRPKGPGVLQVLPRSVHMKTLEKTAGLTLTARKGRVTWTAASGDPRVTLSAARGGLPSGGRTTIQVILDRQLITLPGSTTVTVTDGEGHSTAVTVSWDMSLL